MSTRTLVLTPWMAPHRVVPWQRAIVLSWLGKVEVIEEHDEIVRSPSRAMRAPAVVRLTRGNVQTKQRVRFSRRNVLLRDDHRCQYCGEQKEPSALNYDHVIPRVRGGATDWLNIVACCYPCNAKKGARTPQEAGMKLRRRPYQPRWLPLSDVRDDIPRVWKLYCA